MKRALSYLRIAWTVFCAMVCLLMLNCWVGNYERDRLIGPAGEYWLEFVLIFTLAIVPWTKELMSLPKSFSLRTLLIAMTAVAVGLWFIVWMAGR